MFEKVNPSHPDKVADRIAGAIVDLCYKMSDNPKVACEVLIGHKKCYVQVETSECIKQGQIEEVVWRITADKDILIIADIVPQDPHLAKNQCREVRCGDNGVFKGCPISSEQRNLTEISDRIYREYPSDGKYILNGKRAIVCQSNADGRNILTVIKRCGVKEVIINPLGDWTGGVNIDSGATNRKLGSDMGDGVTGGGLHGKDLSKADVSVNIVCHLLAQKESCVVFALCAIGDTSITFDFENGMQITLPYIQVVEQAKNYVLSMGGFEKFAEWGLIRP